MNKGEITSPHGGAKPPMGTSSTSIDPRLKDKWWRICHLYKIVDKNSNLVVFKPNTAQKILHDTHHTRNIILKARQLGITTYSVIDMLDDVLFKQNFTAVLIAHDLDSMKKIFEKVILAWDHFPSKLKDAIGWKANTETKNELKFNNGSSISISLSSRSSTTNRLHVSEFGKICAKYPEKAQEIITGAFPSVVPNGRIDIESTAEGDTGYFHDMYVEAESMIDPQTDKDYKAFFFPWTLDPLYQHEKLKDPLPKEFLDYQKLHNLSDFQIAWYYLEQRTLKKKIRQEYPTTSSEAFESTGAKVIDQSNLERRLNNDVEEGDRVGDYTYYEPFIPGHAYAIGVDVSEGIGRDHSAIVVIDFSHKIEYQVVPKVVATYKNNQIDPTNLAFEVQQVALRYGSPIVAVERNNNGIATLAKLKELYFNIFKERKKEGFNEIETERFGWHTNRGTKPHLLFSIKGAIENDEVFIPDKTLLQELKSYGQDNLEETTFNPDATSHFDLLMAFGICWQMRNYATISGSAVQIITEELIPNRMLQ